VESADGFTLDGTLSLNTGDGNKVTFEEADVDVRFDENGRLRSISGEVEIPIPHSRIAFAEPVRADVGVFTGRFLNEERDLGILLKDDTDYFVFFARTALKYSLASGEAGGATQSMEVHEPTAGGRILMIVDYRDPMYYVYGEVDLIGAAGIGWSLNDRIPFVPKLAVDGLGTFDGSSTRTGTFPFKKIMSITGQMVDNRPTELHLSQEDPFASDLGAAYQAGFNGTLSLDLALKELFGIEIHIAEASGGIKAEAGTQTGFNGYAFARGMTSRDLSWWPAFLPARPVRELEVQARIESSGGFQVLTSGEYGWDFPAGRAAMTGSFELTNQAMTLKGATTGAPVNFNLTGVVTLPFTTLSIEPPPELLAVIHKDVNDQVLAQIAGAQKAYDNLTRATENYEFEVSLRGIRTLIPGIVAIAKQGIDNGIAEAFSGKEKEFWYGAAVSIANVFAQPYKDRLDAVAAEARKGDNAATRAALEGALRTLLRNKTIEVCPLNLICVGPFDILTPDQADKVGLAADYVKYIPAASNVMISMRQIYNLIPDRLIFEQVRDNLQNGLLVMKDIELGLVIPHQGTRTFALYADIGGKRYEVGLIEALTVPALAAGLPEAMIQALRAD